MLSPFHVVTTKYLESFSNYSKCMYTLKLKILKKSKTDDEDFDALFFCHDCF